MRTSTRVVIYGSGGRYNTIPNGQQVITIPITGAVDVATNGVGNWVIVGTEGAAYSTDKINWVLSETIFSAIPKSIETDNSGNWVILDFVGDMYTSIDNGVSWTPRASPSYASLSILAYHPSVDKFYVLGNTQHMVSDDSGITWTDMVISGDNFGTATTNGSRVVIAGDNGNSRYTDDGISWSISGLPIQTIRGADYGNGIFAFVGNSGLEYTSTTGSGIWLSNDINASSVTAHEFIIYIESELRWVTCNNLGDWYESVDHTTWTPITSGDFYGLVSGRRCAHDISGYVILTITSDIIIK